MSPKQQAGTSNDHCASTSPIIECEPGCNIHGVSLSPRDPSDCVMGEDGHPFCMFCGKCSRVKGQALSKHFCDRQCYISHRDLHSEAPLREHEKLDMTRLPQVRALAFGYGESMPQESLGDLTMKNIAGLYSENHGLTPHRQNFVQRAAGWRQL